MSYATKGAVVVIGASTGIGAACALRLDQLVSTALVQSINTWSLLIYLISKLK